MIQPGSVLDCAMNCGWWDEDLCRAPVGAECYCNSPQEVKVVLPDVPVEYSEDLLIIAEAEIRALQDSWGVLE